MAELIENFTERKQAILTGTKLAVACTVVFVLYVSLNWPYGYWSVVSVAAVARPGLKHTLGKAITRIVGTILGACLGYCIGLFTQGSPTGIVIFFFIGAFIAGYIAAQDTILTYGGIVFGFTTSIVLASYLLTGNLFDMAVYRSAEVLLGVSVVALLNLSIRSIFQRDEQIKTQLPQQFSYGFQMLFYGENKRRYLKPALQIALAATITFLPWVIWRYPGGFWATISCFLVMEENVHGVQRKSFLRFCSHVVAALLGMLIVLLVQDHIWYLLIPLVISFFMCGYLMVVHKALSTSYNTIAIALAVMLLADPGLMSTFHIIFARFVNVVAGVAVGILVSRYFLARPR